MIFKRYKLFLENQQSKKEIDSICKKYGIRNYTINDDSTIDVDDNVHLYNMELTKLPLKFGRVTGSFNCGDNQLISLEGCPSWVGGCFDCRYNKLASLEGCVKYVGEYFNCDNNQLKTLKGGPEVVILGYSCDGNYLVNFKGFPDDFEGGVSFTYNPVHKLLRKIQKNGNSKYPKFIYWCNEYDAIDDDGIVIPERMEEVYNKLGMVYED